MITANLEYNIEKTKDNYIILKIKKDDKWIYIGSKYNMKNSIDKFMEKNQMSEEDEEKIFIIFGFGTGDHIKELRKKYKNNIILVFEPNEKLEDYISDLQWAKEDEKMQILCCDEDALKNFMENSLQIYNIHNLKLEYFDNYNKTYETEFMNFIKTIKDKLIAMEININTSTSYDIRWFETLTNNLPYIVNGTPAELYRDEYKDKPVVIVSAGPSLDKNIDLLKDFGDKVVILTGGRTLKPLMERNIQPTLLGAIDPSIESYKIMEEYVEDCTAPLLFYDGTNENVVTAHKNEKIFFGNRAIVDRIAERKISNYCWGGSVAHALTVFSVVLGCNPIIFIGQDCAYTNEKYYADSSKHSSLRDEIINREGIYVEAVGGGTVRTDLILESFKVGLEETIVALSNNVFINATEGGARIKGTIEMTLKQALEKYSCKEKINPLAKKKYPVDMKKNSIDILNEAKKAIEIIIDKCSEALKYLEKLEKEYKNNNDKKVNSILKKLDNIDKVIISNSKSIDIAESLVYPIIYDTMTTYITLENKPNDEKMKAIIFNSNKFYMLLLKRLEYAREHLDETLDRIENN